jgi:hypothetical protein
MRPSNHPARRSANKNAAEAARRRSCSGVMKNYFFLPAGFLAAVFLPAAFVVVFFFAAIINLPSYWDVASFCFDS